MQNVERFLFVCFLFICSFFVRELVKASLVMCKMNIIDKMRKKATENFGRRHFKAEKRASTQVLREECAGLVRTDRGPVQLERGE